MEASFPHLPNKSGVRGAHCARELDLTTRSIALGLSQQLDPLSERQIWDMFPLEKEAIELRPPKNKATSGSRAPKYAVQAMDLAQLPSKYLSGKLYILDFDQAYPARDPPRSLLGIPPRYFGARKHLRTKEWPASRYLGAGMSYIPHAVRASHIR